MKHSVRKTSHLWRAFACLCAVLLTHGIAAAHVTVQLADGRELSGEVDARTDEHLLWIRDQSEQVVLTTSAPWSLVLSATLNDKELSQENLPELLRQQATAEKVGFLVQQVVYTFPQQPQAEKRPVVIPRIRSLAIDAFLVNLDRDVEPDGIELAVAALDEHGLPVPVEGSLYARLWGERIHSHGSHVRFEELQRWTQPVVPIDFSEGVASYALRFRTVHPELDYGLHSNALVNVRLGITGQGNFAATVPVQIRAFNPFRDQLQLYQGSRFLRGELTEEVRHLDRSRQHTRPRTWAR